MILWVVHYFDTIDDVLLQTFHLHVKSQKMQSGNRYMIYGS